jgi:GNAT superfamily N-acetyltransferase
LAPAEIIFHKLSKEDNVTDFDCGHIDTNEFIKEDAMEYQKRDIATTYVIREDGKVVGFISLAMGTIRIRDHPRLHLPGIGINEYPAIKIGRLGVDKRHTRRGLGTRFLDLSMNIALELKDRVGCRFLSVDAYPHRINWYRDRGFKSLFSKQKDRKTMPMYARVSGD